MHLQNLDAYYMIVHSLKHHVQKKGNQHRIYVSLT
jgi:hypothetical protein